ncbi:MAG: methyltransferase domain-containing protein [Mycobacteriaceae bacterium]
MDRDFPPGFFDRADPSGDDEFYVPLRLVTHIDDAAIAAVRELYAELGLGPHTRVLDLMSSWVSHLPGPVAELVALGMNAAELDANPAATERLVHDLNADPTLPLADARFDVVTCCVSVDYLTHPVEVLTEAARVLAPDGVVALTFSNRLFPTKAVRGWLAATEQGRCVIASAYLEATGRFSEATVSLRTPPGVGDPLYAVTARRIG